MKRYIYILIGLVVIAALAVLGLFLWKNYSSSAPGTAQTGTTGTLPSAETQGNNGGANGQNQNGGTAGTSTTGGSGNSGTGSIVAGSFGPLSSDPVLNYFVGANNTVFVIEPNGVIAEIANGQTSYLSSSTVTGMISGSFSYNGKKALVNFGDPNDPQSSVFDVTAKTWTPLPRGMQSPQWSPLDYRVAYIAPTATGTETLGTVDASNPKKGPIAIFTLHANDLSLQWVNKNQFALSDKPSAYAPGSALVLDAQAGTITPIALAISGLESIWSAATTSIPSEGLVFFAGNAGTGGTLQLDDLSGNTLQNLNVATLPSKCGFAVEASSTAAVVSSTNPTAKPAPYLVLYCGIPRNTGAFSSSRLPDDYEQMALFTTDNIYRINTQTGAIDDLWGDTNQNVDVSNIKSAGNSIFFINRYNNELYLLTLQND